VDVQPWLFRLETEPEEENEIFYEAVDYPATVVQARLIVRIFARFRAMFFLATWSLGGAFLRA
jgi:hypothetical protein